eukprot:TRINITY_DN17298_c0_g1_i1.p1 TRINITY_DN17298_c0_g1~~TRINITY_DN17298_c0_g1_i1.p1  ORF type:complete len:113 (-),score=20.21 TRINITY_DN17298_c0_g1_i1:197-535(-)
MSRAGLWERFMKFLNYRHIPNRTPDGRGTRFPAPGSQPEIVPRPGPAHHCANNYYYTRDVARNPKHLEAMRISSILSLDGTPQDIQPAFVDAAAVLQPLPPKSDAQAIPDSK